jgi:hypothetical protein
MAKARGHRANKPNDSFGTINNDSLYRGKHREDVYKDDDEDNEAEETVEAQEADPEEATPQQASSFVEQKQEPDHDYKKRYDDLKRHYDTKVNEFKQEIAELKTAMQSPQAQMPKGVAMPKTPEELQAFKDPKWAARVIDLYKADTSVPAKKKKTTKPSAADAVTRASAREVATAKVEGKVWKASEIRNLKPWEFEKLEEELDIARLEGRIDPNN